MMIDEKKAELCRLWSDLHVTKPESERYYFIPTSWLSENLQEWSGMTMLSIDSLLCRHQLLNWKSMNKVKVVSERMVGNSYALL